MNPANEFLKFLALFLMVATFDLKGSFMIFIVKELVNSRDTFSPKGFFPEAGLATGTGLY
jgi:hypothetical protein